MSISYAIWTWSHWGFFPRLTTESCALGSTQPLKMSTRKIPGSSVRLTTYYLLVPNVKKIRGLNLSDLPWACSGLLRDSFTFYFGPGTKTWTKLVVTIAVEVIRKYRACHECCKTVTLSAIKRVPRGIESWVTSWCRFSIYAYELGLSGAWFESWWT
jgi:hypothetical protein